MCLCVNMHALVCVYVSACVNILVSVSMYYNMCRSQKIACESRFFFSTVWAWELNLISLEDISLAQLSGPF